MKGLNIPERFTGIIYVSMYGDPNSCIYGMLSFSKIRPREDGDEILLGQVDVDIPLDATGSLDKQVAQLRKSKQEIIDEASSKARQIDGTIESLLAIEHKGEMA